MTGKLEPRAKTDEYNHERQRDDKSARVSEAIFPGLAITVTVFAYNMLGDTLRDVLDPRLRGSR